MVMSWCNTFWELFDIYCRLQDDVKLDPKAIIRAKAAVEKHKKSCAECKRLNPNVPMAAGE
jgi:hypothetical protein